jgi:hypothetical protein
VELATVHNDADSGLNEITIRPAGREPLAEGVRTLRFEFANGPIGFNVYREIAVFGAVQ